MMEEANYVVVFNYSFDNESAAYLFGTEGKAKQFLHESFQEEVRIETEENGLEVDAEESDDLSYASITTYCDGMEDSTEIRVAKIYR